MAKKEDLRMARLNFESVGHEVREMNWYQFRISPEEYDGWFDWYHTTGALVMATRTFGRTYHKRVGTCRNSDAVIEEIYKRVYAIPNE